MRLRWATCAPSSGTSSGLRRGEVTSILSRPSKPLAAPRRRPATASARKRRLPRVLAVVCFAAAIVAAVAVVRASFTPESPRLPSISRNPYPRESLWRTPVPAGAALDPQNQARLAYWLRTSVKNPNMTLRAWGVAVVRATSKDPAHKIHATKYAGNLNRFGPIHVPNGARPSPSSDAHLAVYDPVERREWDMWQADCCWSAAAGQAQSTASGNGIAPFGTVGADAANFPLLGGLVLADEMRRGRINHALHFSIPGVGAGEPVCPATHNDGTNTNPLALPEGTHMQLDPGLDLATVPLAPWEKTIARALQTYGMYLRDGGGTLAIAAENPINRAPDPWVPLFGRWSTAAFFSSSFPWASMRILAPVC
jgi:hypothetical protein